MLNAVLLLFLHHTRLSKVCHYATENIFLFHWITRLSKICFCTVVKINLKFIAINSELSAYMLSCFTFTAACLFYHLF